MINIMVVDDNTDTVNLYKMLFKLEGFHVDIFTEPEKALQAFPGTRYDIILTDYHMPEMNGLEFINQIRKLDSEIPIIIITVNSMIEEVIESCKDHVNGYIQKPFSNNEIIDMVKSRLRKK